MLKYFECTHSYFLAAAEKELLGDVHSRLQLEAFQKILIQSIFNQAAMNVIMDIAMNTTMDIRGQAALNMKVDFIMLILLHHQNILHTAGYVLFSLCTDTHM